MEKSQKESELLDQVIIFLIILVGSILIFSQYQIYKLSKGFLVYTSIALVIVLVVLVLWLFFEKKPKEETHHPHHQEHHAHVTEEKPKPLNFMEKLSYSLVAIVAVLIIFNQAQIYQVYALSGISTGLTLKTTSTKTQLALTGDPTQDAMAVVIPKGTPFYGDSLGVSFEDPIRSLEIIANLDPAYGKTKVQLTPEEKQRYISILTTPTITCEFCCGVKTAVTSDGRPTCGCKHSWAIRGLAAYLIKNYPQSSDDEIKRELAKWKGLFFPKQMIQRYIQEAQTGQYTPDIAALLLEVDEKKLKEMKAAVASQGNTQSSNGVAANIKDLPSMVGGC